MTTVSKKRKTSENQEINSLKTQEEINSLKTEVEYLRKYSGKLSKIVQAEKKANLEFIARVKKLADFDQVQNDDDDDALFEELKTHLTQSDDDDENTAQDQLKMDQGVATLKNWCASRPVLKNSVAALIEETSQGSLFDDLANGFYNEEGFDCKFYEWLEKMIGQFFEGWSDFDNATNPDMHDVHDRCVIALKLILSRFEVNPAIKYQIEEMSNEEEQEAVDLSPANVLFALLSQQSNVWYTKNTEESSEE